MNCADCHIEYRDMHGFVNEVTDGFALIYAYGVSKCQFQAGLTGRPIHNLDDLNCTRQGISITAASVP